MSVRSVILRFLVALRLWPAVARGQSPELIDAAKRFRVLFAQGLYEEALPFAEKALRLSEREFGPGHPATAIFLNNLGRVYKAQGRYAEAEPLHKRALAILEEARGPEHSVVASSLQNYAALLRKTGRGTEAAKMETRAKAIRAKHAEQNPAN